VCGIIYDRIQHARKTSPSGRQGDRRRHMDLLESFVWQLVMEDDGDPHTLALEIRERSEFIHDYMPDSYSSSGYRHGAWDKEIADPVIIEEIKYLESLPLVHQTDEYPQSGRVRLYRDPNDGYYAEWVGERRHMWYAIPDRYTEALDKELMAIYNEILERLDESLQSQAAKQSIAEKLRRCGLWK
jgi:hypothetical protein